MFIERKRHNNNRMSSYLMKMISISLEMMTLSIMNTRAGRSSKREGSFSGLKKMMKRWSLDLSSLVAHSCSERLIICDFDDIYLSKNGVLGFWGDRKSVV